MKYKILSGISQVFINMWQKQRILLGYVNEFCVPKNWMPKTKASDYDENVKQSYFKSQRGGKIDGVVLL